MSRDSAVAGPTLLDEFKSALAGISPTERSRLDALPEVRLEFISSRPSLDWKLWEVFYKSKNDEEAAALWRDGKI